MESYPLRNLLKESREKDDGLSVTLDKLIELAQSNPKSADGKIILPEKKEAINIPSVLSYGDITDPLEDAYPNYDRSKVDEEYKNNPYMASYVRDMVALCATPFQIVTRPGYNEEGVEVIENFFKEYIGTRAEFEQNLEDIYYYLYKQGMALYRRMNWSFNKNGVTINAGNRLTLRRAFFKVSNIQELKLDKYRNIELIMFDDGTTRKGAAAKDFKVVKINTPSNEVWGESQFRQNFHQYQRLRRMMNVYVMGLENEAFPHLVGEIDEEKIIDIFMNQLGNTSEKASTSIKEAQTRFQTTAKNYRKTSTQGLLETAYLKYRLLNTEMKRAIHPEVKEIFRIVGESSGRGELLSGGQTNKATLQIISRHMQNINVKPTREVGGRTFVIPEFNNIFLQLGRLDLMDSTTIVHRSSETIDAKDEADIIQSLATSFGPKYIIREARNKFGLELTEEDVAFVREDIARNQHEKNPDDEEVEEDDDDEV